MYRNQYIALNYDLSDYNKLNKTYFGRLIIYSHPSLNIIINKSINAEVLLLGYIINPLYPKEKDDKIIEILATNCHNKEMFFREVQSLSGRFVLFFKTNMDFIVLNDPISMRNIYYSFDKNNIILTSSQKMFMEFYGKDLLISDTKKYFINLMKFYEKQNEFSWFGDEGIDDRLLKVLPNHYLDLNKKTVYRSPVFNNLLVNPNDALEYSSAILRGTIEAISNRYNILQTLTAGWDSRTCLAAAKDFKDRIQFFVFDNGRGNENSPDVFVSKNLSRKLDLKFKVIDLNLPKDNFLIHFKKEHVIPSMSKVQDIQYFYENYCNSNTIRVSGIGGEIIKCFYGYTKRDINESILFHLTSYPVKNCIYIKEKIRQWLEDTKEFSESTGIPLLDLFYWEQRLGNWGSLYPFEQDIAIEENCPHNHKNLILSLFRIPINKRSYPKCVFIYDLIKSLWPETLSEPINPVGTLGNIKKYIRKYALLRYYKANLTSGIKEIIFKKTI